MRKLRKLAALGVVLALFGGITLSATAPQLGAAIYYLADGSAWEGYALSSVWGGAVGAMAGMEAGYAIAATAAAVTSGLWVGFLAGAA